MMDPGPDLPLRQSYHHGDLRSALLAAAEQELAEKGIENFSMRGVAKRAGVSHAVVGASFSARVAPNWPLTQKAPCCVVVG